MPGKTTVSATFIIMEKTSEGNQAALCGFIDLEKAHERVPREVMYCCMKRNNRSNIVIRRFDSKMRWYGHVLKNDGEDAVNMPVRIRRRRGCQSM